MKDHSHRKANMFNQKKKHNGKRTYVAFVLDKSGSMSSIRDAAISGYNEQVDVIKEEATKGGDTYVSLVTFNQSVSTVYLNEEVDRLEYLSVSSFEPSGTTAMYDAVGMTVQELRKYDDGEPDVAFLVIVVSDGLENASKDFSSQQIADLVAELQATKRWTFAYIGANQDLTQVQQQTNFGSTLAYAANNEGMAAMYDTLASSTRSYFSSRSAGMTSVDEFIVPEEETTD